MAAQDQELARQSRAQAAQAAVVPEQRRPEWLQPDAAALPPTVRRNQ